MSNTLTKARSNWTAARPGDMPAIGMTRLGIDGAASWHVQPYATGQSGLRLRELCSLQDAPSRRQALRMVGVQGRGVSVDLYGTKPSAPATAHVNAIFVKGGTGPYTWRRPV